MELTLCSSIKRDRILVTPRYKIGDRVCYKMGKELKEVVIQSVSTGNWMFDYDEPLYVVSLHAKFNAAVYESELIPCCHLEMQRQAG